MHVKDLLFDFCQLLLLHAGPSVLVAKKLHDSQGCIANEQSTIAITGSNGTIPKTPGWLPLNATCQWNITAPVNKVFRINITASFQKPCIDNHLRIHDGPSDASDIMTEYNCNSTLVKRTFFSSGRSLWLEVKTGIPENSIAIRVSYEAQEKQECSINNTVNVPQSSTEYNFSSPYYPYGYHRNKTCGWYITAPENHVVKLYFLPKLNDWNTLKQSVHIYDVEDSDLTAISLGYWIIYSKFRFVYVVFKSDAKADGDVQPGIFVIYSAIKTVRACSLANSYDENMNIELRNASGVIKSPWYPHSFPRELENRCHWKIIAPKRKVVRIEFLSFRVWDIYVEIADRINALYPRIVKFSGKLPSFNFYSTGHELSIMVKGNGGNDGAGFIANYSSILAVSSGTCNLKNGSTVYLTGEGRAFSTPRYPLNPGKGTCNWNITVPPGEFVKVTFWEMVGHDVQNYATVYDVTNSNWHRLGTYARNYRKNEFYSIGNSVLVVFTSLYLVYPGGFFASYETLKAVPAKYSCSKPSPYWWSKNVVTLYSSQGEFASFGYPLPYPNDVECSWKIEAGAGYVIQLTFHSFHVGQSRYCWSNADHLEIFANYHGWRTGTFCGPSLPPVIQSNISSMHVYFQTDSSGRYPGFYASYKMLPDPSMGPCKDPGQDNIIPMTGETGKLFSPQYPRSFAGSIQCTWVITAPEGQFVKLKIKTLYLGPYCSDSALYIWDGQNSYSDLLNKYCKDEGFQSSQSAVFSSGRYLRVRFRSWKNFRSYVSKFDAVFEVVKQVPAPYSCTEKNQNTYLKSTSGSLASYNYPLPYDEYARCSWQFNMDSDYKIKLWFDFFNVPCKDGRVRLLNKKYCGSEKPPSVTLKNSDTVSFNSHGLDEYMGFKATYEAEKASVLSQRKIVGISVGILSVLCVAILVGYKRWKKKNRVPHGAVVHNLTNDVVIEQQQDTAL